MRTFSVRFAEAVKANGFFSVKGKLFYNFRFSVLSTFNDLDIAKAVYLTCCNGAYIPLYKSCLFLDNRLDLCVSVPDVH